MPKRNESASLIDDVINYYAQRAEVYDETAGYTDGAAEELRLPVKERFRKLFIGHDVLEIACGSGYWTAVVGEVAGSVLAVDVNESMIEQARERCRRLPRVTFRVADAFTLAGVPNHFTAVFGVWWWSHIPKSEIRAFLTALNGRLVPGALVLFSDQLPYDGPSRRMDADGNVIETRSLPDGRTFEIVKNFPTADEVIEMLEPFADNIEFVERPDEKNWTVTCSTKR